MRRIATQDDNVITIVDPVSGEELLDRQLHYPLVAPNQFAKQFRNLFEPVKFKWSESEHELRLNVCTNPFCKWFGMPQTRFESVKHKPYRYKLTGDPKERTKDSLATPILSTKTLAMGFGITAWSF